MNNEYKLREFKCLGCGEMVKKRRARNKTKYCSFDCYIKSKRPQRRTGEFIKCEWCGKEVYKCKCHLEHEHHFCSLLCANKYQARNKLVFMCKMCGNQFKWSKSRITQANPTYCSWKCRLQDKEHIVNNGIKAMVAQQNKRGLNKLELCGRGILNDMGVIFDEQVLLFNKFLVDVLLRTEKLVIQWDGEYWHNRPKRKALDKSQDAYLMKCGYRILRITDKQIKEDKGGVCENIKRAIQEIT